MAYKMKGSPMQRNFGISPAKDRRTTRVVSVKAQPERNIKEETKMVPLAHDHEDMTDDQNKSHRKNFESGVGLGGGRKNI